MLGLNVTKPDDDMYRIIKAIYDDINNEMGFIQPFDLKMLSQTNGGVYNVKRVLIESVVGGSNYFATQGAVSVLPGPPNGMIPGMPAGQTFIQDDRQFEGWKYDEPSDNTPQ